MRPQATFRLVFAGLFLLLFGVVGTYRRKAQAGRRVDYSAEGQGLFIAQAWQWIEGASLYDEIWEHKPGGVITLYGLALEFGGIRPAAQVLARKRARPS